MAILDDIVAVLKNVLQLSDKNNFFSEDTALLGAIPEFDSMAVVSILTALEEKFGFYVDDDEIDAEVFETVSSLVDFVEQKLE